MFYTLSRPNEAESIQFTRKDLEDIFENKKDDIGLSHYSFSNNVYYINLDNKRMLMMYDTPENKNVIDTYTDILYDEVFDPVNKLKFEPAGHNLVTVYAGNGDYTDLPSASLLLVEIVLDSSFLVSLTNNINLATGKTKIIFDSIDQNSDNLYQSDGRAVIAYNGFYSVQGVIELYCTSTNFVPIDINIAIVYNNSPLVETTISLRFTNEMRNVPINLCLKLNKDDEIFLELTPGVASDKIFVSESSYWNCRLLSLLT